jgi:hypothetical protein
MQMCWNKDPNQRPVSFLSLIDFVHTHYWHIHTSTQIAYYYVLSLFICIGTHIVWFVIEELNKDTHKEKEIVTPSLVLFKDNWNDLWEVGNFKKYRRGLKRTLPKWD